jgi:hypothetical protein
MIVKLSAQIRQTREFIAAAHNFSSHYHADFGIASDNCVFRA